MKIQKFMTLLQAQEIAISVVQKLRPFCNRIEIAGSIRRQRPEVGDIEVVLIPNPSKLYDLYEAVNSWQKVKGKVGGKYTQRILPEGIKLDIFMCQESNWGNIYAVRTGSAEFSHQILARGWVKAGYRSDGGFLYKGDERICVREEKDLFDLICVQYVEPEFREVFINQ